jgi:hypothetical protein
MKLLGAISVGFDVTDQLLIRFSALARYWRKNWSMRQYISYSDFKKTYDSVRRELLYNILTEFGVPMESLRLIKMCLNETFSKEHICNFLIQKGLKQGAVLSPLFFNFALEYAIMKVQENQVGLKLNGTHQFLAYADDVNLMGDNIDTMKKNTETLIDARKEVGLEINVEKTKYMFLSHHQNVGQNWDIKIANRSFENVSQFKYLGMTVTTIQSRAFCLLVCSKKKIRIYKTIILPVFLYGCETCSLTLRGEYRLRLFENRVLREYLDQRQMK